MTRWPEKALIALTMCYVVLPRLIQSVTAPKYKALLGSDATTYSALAALSDLALFGMLAMYCGALLLSRLRRLRTDGGLLVALLLSPWFYLVLRDLAAGERPRRVALLYPLLMLTVWQLRPRLDSLAVLGGLITATAALSISMGVLTPEWSIYRAVSGELIAPEKLIVPWGVLVGPLSNGNNLGQLLVLGLPAVLFLRPRLLAVMAWLIIATALVWTASRSSLLAMGVALLTLMAMHSVARQYRWVVGGTVLMTVSGLLIGLPLTTTDPTAFSNRGLIWQESLLYWQTSPTLGLSSTFYTRIGDYVNPLGTTAFHGHNQLVHILVTGGLLYLALVIGIVGSAALRALRWLQHRRSYPVVYLAVLTVSCTLEVSFGVVDRGLLIAVTVLPLAWILLSQPATSPGTSAVGPRRLIDRGVETVSH